MSTREHTDQPMRHRMVVFGHDTMFMSHLPMFSMHEHAYQVILETELTADDGTDPMQVYRDDRNQHPDVAFYTFDPGRFVLPDILPADGQPATSTTFTGDLYRHHELDAESIAASVQALTRGWPVRHLRRVS